MARYLLGLALLCAVPLALLPLIAARAADEKDAKKPDDKTGKEAKRLTAPDGWLKSLPVGFTRRASKPKDKTRLAAGYAKYNNCGVNLSTTLNGTAGSTAISVFADDVEWQYAFGSAPTVTSPAGDGGVAGGGWRFPNAHRFGIVVYQGNNYWNVDSTDPNNPTRITGLSNTTDIIVAVNDTNGNYADNSGAFDIYVRKDN
jgi:hypothetical protein